MREKKEGGGKGALVEDAWCTVYILQYHLYSKKRGILKHKYTLSLLRYSYKTAALCNTESYIACKESDYSMYHWLAEETAIAKLTAI